MAAAVFLAVVVVAEAATVADVFADAAVVDVILLMYLWLQNFI